MANLTGATIHANSEFTGDTDTNPLSPSDWSLDVVISPTIPNIPTNVSASDNSVNIVHITWNSVTGANTYQIWRSTNSNPANATQLASTQNTSYDDSTASSGVSPCTIYYYWVKACNSNGCSELPESFGFDAGSAQIPTPVINSCAFANNQWTILGSNFGSAQGNVYFSLSPNSLQATPLTLKSWSDTSIQITPPANCAGSGYIIVNTASGFKHFL
ncbi:MAG: hypothetical protein HQK77_19455 [Desulfobacterales bacterium]|nr:hypothetical protein [Desulfobacterales bacterium]